MDRLLFSRLSVVVLADGPERRDFVDRALVLLGVGRVSHAADVREAITLLAEPGAAIDVVVCASGRALAADIGLREAIARRAPPPLVVTIDAGDRLSVALPSESTRDFAHEAAAPLMTLRILPEVLLEQGTLAASDADDVRKILRAAQELTALIDALRRPR